jgi:NAD dependent epimerase/dehydratase family enzyme
LLALKTSYNLLLVAISSRARRISWEPYTLKGVKSENEVYALLRSTTFLLHATLITTLSPIYRHSHLHCKIDVVVDLFDESISPRNMPTQNKKNISLSQCKKSTASYQGNNKRTQ